jgi:transposase
VLQVHFNWKTHSAIASITLWNFYFRLYPGSIRAPQDVAFLEHLLRHIPGKQLSVWDRPPALRSRVVQQFVAAQKGRIRIEYLPAYAPELNPSESIWGHVKRHKLPNACPKDFAELQDGTRRVLRNMRRRPTLNTAFWKQASLWPESPYTMRDSAIVPRAPDGVQLDSDLRQAAVSNSRVDFREFRIPSILYFVNPPVGLK